MTSFAEQKWVLDQEVAEKIWDILEKLGGVSRVRTAWDHDQCLAWLVDKGVTTGEMNEFRFIGDMGNSAKIFFAPPQEVAYVSVSPDDAQSHPRAAEQVKQINHALTALADAAEPKGAWQKLPGNEARKIFIPREG
jgi:hypothetical protein